MPTCWTPRNDGTVHRGIVACLRHGWRFDLRDGRCVNFTASPPVATFPMTILVRLYASAVCPYSIESISYVDHNEGCEQMISGKSQIRCRIPHSKGLWCVGPFIALVLLFTAIVPVNEVGEGLNLKRLV